VPTSIVTRAGARREVERCGRIRIRQRLLSLTLDTTREVLRSILAALAGAVADDDVLTLQVILGRAVVPRLVAAKTPDPTASWVTTALQGTQPAPAELRSSMRAKVGQYRFRAVIRIGASAATIPRRRMLIHSLLAALRETQAAGTRIDLVPDRPDAIDTARLPIRQPLRLTPDEAVTFLAWPCTDSLLPGLPGLHPRLIAPPRSYRPAEERAFAQSAAAGREVPVGIGIRDALHHTHVLGPTGVGKSTLLLHLIQADMQAGRSIVVIDPKRDLGVDVLSLVPEARRADVVVLDPTLPKPVGLNPLASSGDRAPLVADSILAIFKGLFPSAFGPRTSDILHASLLTLAGHPGSSLVQLPLLLTDASFRRRLTSRLQDPIGLSPFWQQYEALSPAQQANSIGPVMSRLRQFLLRPGLRAVLEQTDPRFDLLDVLTKPRILIVTLNKGVLGPQSAALLGSLVVSQLWQLTLGRAALPKNQRPPVSIYLDEAQNFLHLDADLGEALEQSRSLGVAWHLAHQHRAQMPKDLLAGIDANTRNKVAFSLNITDAAAMSKGSRLLEPEDFTSLPPYEVYASLLSGGRQTDWFSARTLPPPPAISDPDAVLRESQDRYGASDSSAAEAPPMRDPSNAIGSDDEPIGRRPRRRS
jgi:hypothetical protein